MNVASEHGWGYVEYYVYVKDSQKRVVIRKCLRGTREASRRITLCERPRGILLSFEAS